MSTVTGRAIVALRKRIETVCEVCAESMTARLRGAVPERRFCSPACQRRAYRLAHGDRVRAQEQVRRATRGDRSAERRCAQCAASFPTSGRRLYCGRACGQRAYMERHGARALTLQREAHRRKREAHRRVQCADTT